MTHRLITIMPPWRNRYGLNGVGAAVRRHLDIAACVRAAKLPSGHSAWAPDPAGAHIWVWAPTVWAPEVMDLFKELGVTFVAMRPWTQARRPHGITTTLIKESIDAEKKREQGWSGANAALILDAKERRLCREDVSKPGEVSDAGMWYHEDSRAWQLAAFFGVIGPLTTTRPSTASLNAWASPLVGPRSAGYPLPKAFYADARACALKTFNLKHPAIRGVDIGGDRVQHILNDRWVAAEDPWGQGVGDHDE